MLIGYARVSKADGSQLICERTLAGLTLRCARATSRAVPNSHPRRHKWNWSQKTDVWPIDLW